MHNMNFQQLTGEQLLNMADGLVAGGNHDLARQLYEVGARDAADPAVKRRFALRLGLVTTPTPATQLLARLARELDAVSPNVFVGEGLVTWMKLPPFLEDERFMALAAKHAGLLRIANWHWNLQTVLWAVQEALGLDGDLVELGVFRGHTTLFAAEYVNFQDQPKTWWLYDTFNGIPEDQLDPGWAEKNRAAYSGTFSFEEVVQRFAGFPNIRVIQGRVPEVLAEAAPERIAFVHMDLNNATAEIAALDCLFERIVPGGVIVFDDFCWANARAQQAAEIAWFADRSLRLLALPTGQGVFQKR